MQPLDLPRAVATAENWLLGRMAAVGDAVRDANARLAGVAEAPRLSCERCHCDWPTHTMACPTCGGVLAPLVPLVLQCGFCGSANRRDITAQCTACAGPLPNLPGGDPGEQPPPPPRTLPILTSAPAEIQRDTSRAFGIGLVVFGIATIVALLGVLLLAGGLWLLFGPKIREAAKRSALTHGHATRGRIERIRSDRHHYSGHDGSLDYTKYRITYAFEESGKGRKGTCIGFDPAHAMRRQGDEIWVVYVPGQARFRSAIWPPLR